MIGIALMSWLTVAAKATIVDVQSPALQQLKDVESVSADAERNPEQSKEKGDLGFTIQSLKPIGYRTAENGKPQQPPTVPQAPDEAPLPAKDRPAPPAPDAKPQKQDAAGTAGKCYTFTGNSAMKGVTIYSPKEDPTCSEKPQEPAPKEGPISKKLVYGALGLGAAAVAAGFLLWPPALLIGGLLLGAGAVLWYINKKLS